ncbi:MAG: hypothetical protein ACRD26_03960 [Vicinamibacterales bacterium]
MSSAVTVTFTCTDEGSGIASCPPQAMVWSDGASQVVSGTAVDQAGNTATASVTLNIDQSPPLITLSPPASVFTATATLSGVATDAASGVESVTCNGSPATLSGDSFACSVALVPGPNTIDARVVDFAGNSAAVPAVTIERQESTVEGLAAAPPAIFPPGADRGDVHPPARGRQLWPSCTRSISSAATSAAVSSPPTGPCATMGCQATKKQATVRTRFR